MFILEMFCSSEIIGKNYGERRNLVIPVNRCFDTLVDDNLISSKTIHGNLMQKYILQ